jgi:hypothetical protein
MKRLALVFLLIACSSVLAQDTEQQLFGPGHPFWDNECEPLISSKGSSLIHLVFVPFKTHAGVFYIAARGKYMQVEGGEKGYEVRPELILLAWYEGGRRRFLWVQCDKQGTAHYRRGDKMSDGITTEVRAIALEVLNTNAKQGDRQVSSEIWKRIDSLVGQEYNPTYLKIKNK